MYSSFDFGSLLSEYTILSLIRHIGDQNETVIGSVGSDWVFGMGNGSSAYWKMGSIVSQSTPADQNWHLFAGTLSSSGDATLWRDYVKIFDQNTSITKDSKPKFFALGGSQTNERFSNSEVAEVLLYNRILSSSELDSLQSYLRVKWLGGEVEDFPMLVRLSYQKHPSFDLNTFADPSNGGDLRFYNEDNQELIYEVDEWNVSDESLVWVKVPNLTPSSKVIAYWGNDSNTSSPSYRSDGSLWTDFDGVWHLANGVDSSSNSRTATGNGGPSWGANSLIGQGVSLDGVNDYLSTNSYNGISGNNPRSGSLWVKSSAVGGGLLGWGSGTDFWDLNWNGSGPRIQIDGSALEQGLFNLNDNQWHYVAFSYSGLSSDLNETKLFVDGVLVDAPASSVGGVVNTTASTAVHFGSLHNATSHAAASFDEIRISSVARGHGWIKHSYENQKESSAFISYDLSYLSAPVFDSDLNITVVSGDPMNYQIRTLPPAVSYSISGEPSWLSLNTATGEISGTPSSTGTSTFTVFASNAKGDANTSITINSLGSKSIPMIGVGVVQDVGGRNASLIGELLNTGGGPNIVTLYYGLNDGNQNPGNWDLNISVGSFNQGPIPVGLSNLNSGETYYYRFEANNTDFSAWSGVGSFTTLSYDQGTLRFHTGINEDGYLSGLYWDKNGSGEIKIKDANITTQNYIAPDGSSWMLSKASFHFSNDFYLGPNLNNVILEGINALAIYCDGNISIAKSLSGSTTLSSSHVPNGTLQDGFDSYYSDDLTKGLRVGRGQLGGFSGGQGPRKRFEFRQFWCRWTFWWWWVVCW